MRITLLIACGLMLVPLAWAQSGGEALVKRAPTLNGKVDGSIHVMTAENVTLNGNAEILGDLLVPGQPTVRLNGNPVYGGTLNGQGTTTSANHTITLNGGSRLRHVVNRTDPVPLPAVAAPPQPAGTRSVSLNNAGQSPGDFSTLKNLTLNSNVGTISVPPGTYGNLTANSGSGFVLGLAGSASPSVYNLQNLTLNSNSTFSVVGPVVLTLDGGFSTNSSMGNPANPGWLRLRVAGGGLSLSSNKTVHAHLEAPAGTLTLNGGSRFRGMVAAEKLIVNGNAVLELVPPPEEPPSFPDNDQDGMDDAWESAHALNPLVDDANLDNDRDGLSNLVEYRLGLKPNNPDSDGDGLYDGDEIALGLDPTKPNPDTQPPTAPTGLTQGAVTSDRVTLSWQPATDNLKVSGYLVYRDGQPIETDLPIRETTFTDTNLPDGEEFTYQVRCFDFAGNLSPMGPEIVVTTVAADSDHDGMPDEWELKYFEENPAAPGDDADGDGRTNLQEFQAGSNPMDFYNGVRPIHEPQHGGREGPNHEVAIIVRKPDGSPWPNAPIVFTAGAGNRLVSASPNGPEYTHQLTVRADANGLAQVYLEPLPKP